MDYMLAIGSSARPRKESCFFGARNHLSPNGVRVGEDSCNYWIILRSGISSRDYIRTYRSLTGAVLCEHEGCTWSLLSLGIGFILRSRNWEGSVPEPEVLELEQKLAFFLSKSNAPDNYPLVHHIDECLAWKS
ncbi:hypothetical protein Tco_0876964 [Tanacetum coccineum]|uniref:Uncharacterized protein n=1 Tax=Tanacetum coccineum TaxID=301880 RepID=A0ABQ5BX73_9ASTR